MKALSIPSLALFVLVAAAVGCGNKQEAAPSAPASAAPAATTAAPAGTASGAAAAGGSDKPVLGSCNDKSSSVCKEYYGVLPLLAEDLCKGLEGKGVLTKGPTPCSRENLSGTCEVKGDEASELIYYYKQADVTPEMNKTVCEIVGKWTPAKGSPAAAATGASTAAASKPASAPAKPAAGGKKRR
ncbi:Hypothetical protein A7982_05690 [Minicystis rosea]|nr:Hypothetical protein A7982_05690 [Minicystis rosea]